MDYFVPSGLSPLTKTYSLRNISTFDIETDRWLDFDEVQDELQTKTLDDLKREWHNKPINPFLLCYYDNVTKTEKMFDGEDCIKDFLRYYLIKKNRDKFCYGHNAGKFDSIALYQTLMTENCFKKFYPKIVYVNGGIMILRVKDTNKHIWNFRDSMYLMKDSLANLCKSFNPSAKKLTMPQVPKDMTSSEHYLSHKDEWQKYCMNDCKSLAEILTMFNDLIVNSIGGCIGLTTSSTALRTFRKKFLKITLPTYFPWNPFIRQGYYGGRCEVYIMYAPLCGKAYNYVDFNSMYASVMECNEFPISRPKRSVVKDPWDTAGRCGFMECSVETPEDLDIPLLPYRDVGNHNKLLFPLGNWRAVYEYSLIEKALKLGYKIKPHRCIEFKSDFLFKDYVNTMNHIKETNTGALRAIAKLLNNGLYGKFAEKSERDILVTEPHADIRGTFPLPNDVFGFTVKKIERLCAHHLPGISARVTALAMIKLYTEGFEYVKARKGRIFYCDTDSMVVDCKVPTSNRLGAWKLEAEITRAIFFGPKAYCYEYMGKDGELHIEQKIKGFSRPFTKTLTFDDFLRALPPMNDYHVFNEISMSPSSFKEINTRDLCGFSTVVKNRSIKEGYSKRVIDENLYTTKPLLIIG